MFHHDTAQQTGYYYPSQSLKEPVFFVDLSKVPDGTLGKSLSHGAGKETCNWHVDSKIQQDYRVSIL